ncbi:MAG: hypothetical protein K6E47_04695 [Lachnospiraceae bacterium]|nr:hypothetical protein [Lachnospiraceae bacterium]
MQSDINLGVTVRDGKLLAQVSGENCEWMRILLREKGSEWKEFKLDRHPLYPSVFTGSFPHDGKKYEYIFECDKGYFLDDHARLVKSPCGYGILPSLKETEGLKERNIFSDTLNKVCSLDTEIYDWKKDRRPFEKTSDMFVYKLHVRGFTVHESSKIKHPGTFKGVSEKIPYFKSLGITTLILQPCYEFNELMDFHINVGASFNGEIQRTRVFTQPAETIPGSRLNFWGYGTSGNYYAPKAMYASEPENACYEFKNMIRSLHTAGIEVIMEMDYRTVSDSFILENLRFWTTEYHVDGFRINTGRVWFKLVSTDAVLRNVKLLCRDLHDDYEGRDIVRNRIFISNYGFQDCIRRFLKGDEGQIVSASNLFRDNGGRFGKINYLADHDGFTLNDVFSYDERHNEANGEGNRDGREANYSWNCGAEGPTKKHKVIDLRNRMIKNALALLFLSQGVPMLCAGDEFGNTHEGNNNPYCCDNEQGWVIWNKTKRASELKNFVIRLVKLRKEHPVFRNDKILSGNDFEFTGTPDISFHGTKAWYPDFGYYSRTLGVMLNGDYADALDFTKSGAKQPKDDSFLLLINTHWEAHEFSLPVVTGFEWNFVFSTHPMVKSGIRVGREQKELILPRTICLYVLKKQDKPKVTEKEDNEDIKVPDSSIVAEEKAAEEGLIEIKPENICDDNAQKSTEIIDSPEITNDNPALTDINTENGFEPDDISDADIQGDDILEDGWDNILEEDTENNYDEKSGKKYRGIRPDLDDEEPA